MNKLLARLIIAACGGLAVNSYAADSSASAPAKADHAKKDKSHSSSKKDHSSKDKSAKHDSKASEPK